MRDWVIERLIDIAQLCIRLANHLERDLDTRFWNNWVIGRRYSP